MPVAQATATAGEVRGTIDPKRVARGLYERLARALDAIGRRAVDEIKADLGVPVEVGEHGRIIRSSPGDPPRKEFGILQENIEHEVYQQDGPIPLPALRVTSSRPPASANDDPDAPRILEKELNRPFMLPGAIRVKGYAKDELEKVIGQ